MNKHLGPYGYGGYPDIVGMLAQWEALEARNKEAYDKLSPEEKAIKDAEKAERHAKYEAQAKQDKINNYINHGLCPDCTKKLIRGKKNKEGQREWFCSNCSKSYSRGL